MTALRAAARCVAMAAGQAAVGLVTGAAVVVGWARGREVAPWR